MCLKVTLLTFNAIRSVLTIAACISILLNCKVEVANFINKSSSQCLITELGKKETKLHKKTNLEPVLKKYKYKIIQNNTNFVLQGQGVVQAHKYEREPRDTTELAKQCILPPFTLPTTGSHTLSVSLRVSFPLPSSHSAALGSCLASCCLCPDKVLI